MAGHSDYFEKRHPVVITLYLAIVIINTMLSSHPVLIGISFVSSFFMACYVKKQFLWKQTLFVGMPILFFAMVVMPLCYHNGITPLFYVNDMQVTLESVVYGFFISLLLMSMMQWFIVWNAWMDEEKMLYLFGKISSKIALLISMVFRMIPLLFQRWKQIHEGQIGMGYKTDMKGIGKKIRQFLKEMSILVSWSLENAIDTSISMEGRGYGTGKRTTYHLFAWQWADGIMIFLLLVLYLPVMAAMHKKWFVVYYFPRFYMKDIGFMQMVVLMAYSSFILFPVICQMVLKVKRKNKR